MAFTHLIILITINHPRFIATLCILDFPLHLIFIPFLLVFRVITMGVPRKNLAIFIHNNVSIKLTASGYAKQNDKYGVTNHASRIVPSHSLTYK